MNYDGVFRLLSALNGTSIGDRTAYVTRLIYSVIAACTISACSAPNSVKPVIPSHLISSPLVINKFSGLVDHGQGGGLPFRCRPGGEARGNYNLRKYRRCWVSR